MNRLRSNPTCPNRRPRDAGLNGTRSLHRMPAFPLVLAVVLIDAASFGSRRSDPAEGSFTELGIVSMEAASRIAGWLLVTFAVAQLFAGRATRR